MAFGPRPPTHPLTPHPPHNPHPQVILEYEGVVVPDCGDLHDAAWREVAAAEGRSPPPRWALRRADGMKDDQAVSEAFCWARAPAEVRRLATAKAAALARLESASRGGGGDDAAAPPPRAPLPAPGTARLLHTLAAHSVPAALATAAPAARVLPSLEAAGLGNAFATVITADDVARGRPDPEAYLVAAARLGRPPTRCVLIGASNSAVEAAREAGMAALAVAGGAPRAPRAPRYELAAADLVVPSLDTVTMADLRSLFAYEEPVEPLSSWTDDEDRSTRSADDDDDDYGGRGGGAWQSLADEGGGLFGL